MSQEPVIGLPDGTDVSIVSTPPKKEVATSSGKKAARDYAGFGSLGVMAMTALGEYVEVRKVTFALGALVISGVLSFGYRYGRDRGWFMPGG